MEQLNELFMQLINESISSLEMVSEPKDKANGYIELAKAIAMSNLLTSSMEVTAKEVKETKKASGKKETKKANKEKEPKVVEEIIETEEEVQVTDEVQEEPQVVEEEVQEEETSAEFEQSVERLRQYLNEYGEEALNDCVGMFSNGILTSLEDINEENIDAFLIFLDELASAEE